MKKKKKIEKGRKNEPISGREKNTHSHTKERRYCHGNPTVVKPDRKGIE